MEIHTKLILDRIAHRVYKQKETTSEAAAIVNSQLSKEDILTLWKETGPRNLVQLFDQNIGAIRRAWRDQNKPLENNGQNPKRGIERLNSVFEVPYIGGNDRYLPLGDFTVVDLVYQISYYDGQVKAFETELWKFRWLKGEMEKEVGLESNRVVRDVLGDREKEVEKVFRVVVGG